jgi:hydroxysqualene synthase
VSGENVEHWSGKDRHDENFPVGSHLIAPRFREPIHRYYAFARNADDISDSPVLAPEDKIARLNVMEDVLLGRRETGSPSALALRASLAVTGVTPRYATDLLIAFRQDATKLRYENIEELYEYCRYSANPVGRYVLDIHGESDACHAPSDALCTSLQILNHLQDCGKDLAALDRCYLPRTLLDRFGATVEDVRGSQETPGLRGVFAALLDPVNGLNRTAEGLPRAARNRRLRVETAVIVGLAKRLAARLMVGDPLKSRVKLTKKDAVFSVMSGLTWLS